LIDIANTRLFSQQIAKPNFKTAAEVVGWMGAMQAQDYAMVKWAVGLRLPAATDRAIESLLDQGEILRTHLLRPTWHLVSAKDIYWLLELTAPQIRTSVKSRHKGLGLSETVIAKSSAVIEKALRASQQLTRDELAAELEQAGIATNDNRAAHFLMRAEIDGLICSGAASAKNQTYALLEERVPKTETVSRESALENLARTYFASRCPATLQDFVWWSGLSVRDANQALEMLKPDFVPETIGAQTYWFPNSNSTSSPETDPEEVHLLPAFDEFLISYADRSAVLPFKDRIKTISNNGIFWPIIVVHGRVVGTWKRTIKKDRVLVEAEFFSQPDKATILQTEKAAARCGAFIEKDAELTCKMQPRAPLEARLPE